MAEKDRHVTRFIGLAKLSNTQKKKVCKMYIVCRFDSSFVTCYIIYMGLGQKPPGHKPPKKSPPNNEKYKLFIYWYLCTHFGLIVPLFMV